MGGGGAPATGGLRDGCAAGCTEELKGAEYASPGWKRRLMRRTARETRSKVWREYVFFLIGSCEIAVIAVIAVVIGNLCA